MTRPRLIDWLLLLAALVVSAFGLLWYAGASIPYPDPTPELLAGQDAEQRVALTLFFGGALGAVATAVWLRRTRSRRG